MDRFEFWYNLCNIFAQGLLHLFFSGSFTGKKVRVRHFTVYLVFLCIWNCVWFVWNDVTVLSDSGMAILIDAATNFSVWAALCGINHFMLGNGRLISSVAAILAIYVPQLCYGMINSVETMIFPYMQGNQLYIMPAAAMLGAVLLSICCYRLILICFSFKEMSRKPYIVMLFPTCVFFFAAELYVSFSSYGNVTESLPPPETGKQLALFALQAAGLLALLSTLYVYRCACRGFQAQMQVASLTQAVQAQKNYVEEAQTRYKKTTAFRHDVKNHLSVLSGLLKSGDMGQAKEYLKKLETVTEALSVPCYTGNAVVDILLGNKLELARLKGIESEVSVVFPKECKADELDLCVIFANAVDNAVQACEEVKGLKYIYITGERQGDFYMLEFENSCTPGEPPKPGTGLLNVKAAAEKYKGAVTAERKERYFRLNVLLDISNCGL